MLISLGLSPAREGVLKEAAMDDARMDFSACRLFFLCVIPALTVKPERFRKSHPLFVTINPGESTFSCT